MGFRHGRVLEIRKQYLAWTRNEIIIMDDPHEAIEPGMQGTDFCIDSIGTLDMS